MDAERPRSTLIERFKNLDRHVNHHPSSKLLGQGPRVQLESSQPRDSAVFTTQARPMRTRRRQQPRAELTRCMLSSPPLTALFITATVLICSGMAQSDTLSLVRRPKQRAVRTWRSVTLLLHIAPAHICPGTPGSALSQAAPLLRSGKQP